jgi:hypothetical protein
MSINSCEWLHRELARLPLIRFPFEPKNLPDNGIYFFYEKVRCRGMVEEDRG